MPNINIQISCEITVPTIMGTVDFEKKPLSTSEVENFISGNLGEHYLSILIPNDDIFSEIHAKKSDMKKKDSTFQIFKENDLVHVKVNGIFKVNAYSHVLQRIKENASEIYVAGIYCGDYPPFGGNFLGVDVDNKKFPVKAKIA